GGGRDLLVPQPLERLHPPAHLPIDHGQVPALGRAALVPATAERPDRAARAPAHDRRAVDGAAVCGDLFLDAALLRARHRPIGTQGLRSEEWSRGDDLSLGLARALLWPR